MKRAVNLDVSDKRELVAVFPHDESVYCGYFDQGRLSCYKIEPDNDEPRKRWTFSLLGLRLAGATVWEVER